MKTLGTTVVTDRLYKRIKSNLLERLKKAFEEFNETGKGLEVIRGIEEALKNDFGWTYKQIEEYELLFC